MEVQDYLNRKEELEKKRDSLARLQGKLSALIQRINDEYHIPTINAAEQLLAQRKADLRGAEIQYNEKLRSFKGDYHEQLDNL